MSWQHLEEKPVALSHSPVPVYIHVGGYTNVWPCVGYSISGIYTVHVHMYTHYIV